MASLDIFFFEAFEEEEAALRRFLPETANAGFTWKTTQELGISELPPAPIISVRTQSVLPPLWAPHLTAIISRSTGYDHLRRYQQQTGSTAFACGFLPLYCNRAVAEQAMLLWMALLRNLKVQMQQFATFHRDGLTGYETFGKTLLVVGVGNIGGEVVNIGKGLGMNVLCHDLDTSKYPHETYVTLEEGLPQADVIVCAMNLTAENARFFNYEALKKAKKGVVFVNVSRGEQSPATDLLRLLEEGHLGGVGLDVYNEEKDLAVALRNRQSPETPELKALMTMVHRNDVIFTPHNAFNTHEAVVNKSEQTIQQFVAFQSSGKLIWEMPPA